MKRKTLQEVMKMTLKQRFFYYARLTWGQKNFSVYTTPSSNSITVTVWDYNSNENFDYKVVETCYLNFSDDIINLEKHLDKWL